jgi:hypothetical protein
MKLASLLLSLHILLGSLLPHADYTELSKLPDLYEHYQLHLAKSNGKLSLTDFLAMHYTDSQHSQSEGDVELPFQHHHTCVGAVVYFLPDFQFQFTPIEPTADLSYPPLSPFFPTAFTSIFQPPKLNSLLS